MTRTLDPALEPENLAPESTPPSCGGCNRPLDRAPISRVFKTWHARCLERAVWAARDEARED